MSCKYFQTLFITGFLTIISGVGIVQALREVRSGDSVQALHLFQDTFVNPVKRENQLKTLIDSLNYKLTELDSFTEQYQQTFNYSDFETAVEDALFLADDVMNHLQNVNRYYKKDTTESSFDQVRELKAKIDSLYLFAQNSEDTDHLKNYLHLVSHSFNQSIRLQDRRQVRPRGMLALEHFFRYTFFNRTYLRSYESEMEETSVAANTLRPYMQLFSYWLFNDFGEKALQGKDDWLFYKPGIDYLVKPWVRDKRALETDENDNILTDDPVKAIVTFRDQLASRGIDLLVVVVPVKPSVYPEKLNPGFNPVKNNEKISHSINILDQLNSYGVETVDLFSEFADARSTGEESADALFMKTDTHWSARGVRVAAKLIAARVRQYEWFADGDIDYKIDTIFTDRRGDILEMTGLTDAKFRKINLSFETEKTKCLQVYNLTVQNDGSTARSLYRDNFTSADILFLGDSFARIFQTDEPGSAGIVAHVAYELSQPLASIVSDGGASTLVRQTLERRSNVLDGKKLVIWEFVERDFRFGAQGWKDVQL